MENETMEFEVIEMEPETEEKGLSTGVAMAIGALLTAGTMAGIKGAKKLWAKHKAKKALDAEVVYSDEDFDDEFEDEGLESK